MIGRDELFALAAQPIGSAQLQAEADFAMNNQRTPPKEVVETAKRAAKVWLPEGKLSANTTAARDAKKEIRARNYDIEDAIVAAGGHRGQ